MRHDLLLATTVAISLLAGHAQAASKEQCIDANTEAQSLRAAGKFSAARALLRSCIDPSCPGVVRDDCTHRLDELEQHQPTIVFNARDDRGGDLLQVVVKMDGVVLTNALDGRALAMDAGSHAFTFEAEGNAAVSRTLVLREGERSRVELITFAHGTPQAPMPTPTPPPTEPQGPIQEQTQAQGGGRKTLAYALAGGGVVGLGVGSALGLMAGSSWSSAKSECPSAGSCDAGRATSDRSTAVGLATGSTVSFIAGAALLLGGGLLYFTAPSTKRSVGLLPVVTPDARSLMLRGEF